MRRGTLHQTLTNGGHVLPVPPGSYIYGPRASGQGGKTSSTFSGLMPRPFIFAGSSRRGPLLPPLYQTEMEMCRSTFCLNVGALIFAQLLLPALGAWLTFGQLSYNVENTNWECGTPISTSLVPKLLKSLSNPGHKSPFLIINTSSLYLIDSAIPGL